jgi:hypothetical protein
MILKSNDISSLMRNFLLLLLFSSNGVLAQVKFSTVVNERAVAENQYVQVEYTIENAKSIEQFTFPAFKQFRIVQGPVQSSGMSVTNGVMSQYKGMSFILQPAALGKLKIPAASAVVDGKLIRSNVVVIDVIPEGSGRANAQGLHPGNAATQIPEVNEEYSLASDENLADKIKNNLMVVADVNKHTCYEGEPIVATYKLYSRLRSESRVIKRPSLNGFSVFDMMEQENNSPTVEQLNGKSYNVHVIRKTQLFPLQAGTFVLDPVELDNKVRFIKTNRKKSGNSIQHFLDEFLSDDGGDEIQEHNFTLGSKPMTIVVKPLPGNKPVNFNGAIGAFSIDAALKDKEITAGDAIQLTLAIKGRGNFTMINPPSLVLPKGIEAYEPSIKEDVDKTVYPLAGVKTFNYILNGKDTGWYDIPPIDFSYFDPASATYRTASSKGFRVHILPAAIKPASPAIAAPLFSAGRPDGIPVKAILLALGVLVVAALGVYQWSIHRKQQKKSAAVLTPVLKPANETVPVISKDLLDEARWALKSGESQRFYKEVNKAAWKVVTDKVNIPATGLNKPNTIRQLQYKGVNAEVIEKFESVLNECEMALYTPVHDVSDMHQTLNKAEDVIETLKVTLP